MSKVIDFPPERQRPFDALKHRDEDQVEAFIRRTDERLERIIAMLTKMDTRLDRVIPRE